MEILEEKFLTGNSNRPKFVRWLQISHVRHTDQFRDLQAASSSEAHRKPAEAWGHECAGDLARPGDEQPRRGASDDMLDADAASGRGDFAFGIWLSDSLSRL